MGIFFYNLPGVLLAQPKDLQSGSMITGWHLTTWQGHRASTSKIKPSADWMRLSVYFDSA